MFDDRVPRPTGRVVAVAAVQVRAMKAQVEMLAAACEDKNRELAAAGDAAPRDAMSLQV